MTSFQPISSSSSATSLPQVESGAGLRHLPLPLFAVPMGLGGLAMAWREAVVVLGAPAFAGEALMALAALSFLFILGAHAVRLLGHPDALIADLRHPIRSAFAGALSIGLMIIAGGLLPYDAGLATLVWGMAVVIHLAIGVYIVRSLLVSPREVATLTPPLLIPLVGNILAPVIGAKLGFLTVSWMLFGLGGLLFVIVQPLILYRVATGPVLPSKMWPTLVILLAPPAVGSLALSLLTGGFGPGPLALYGYALLLVAVFLTLAPRFAVVPFAMSWWGYTFPTAAFAAASLKAAHAHPFWMMEPLLWGLLCGVTLLILTVLAATIRALLSGHLLQPE
jgi:tellurite resistance protein